METLMAISDLEVDRIIEQVLIRPPSQPYSYSKKTNVLSQEHLWHFQLQEENMQLKEKIKSLKVKHRRKQDTLLKQNQLQQEVLALKRQIDEVLHQNESIQRDINRLRIRNSQINESLKQELQESDRSKPKRQCSCVEATNSKQSPTKKSEHRRKQTTLIDQSHLRQANKQTTNSSTNCNFPIDNQRQSILKRKEHINNLKRVIQNQKTLIDSYQQELNVKEEPPTLDKRTMPSMSRFQPMERPSSLKNIKAHTSIGSIVKVKRH